MEGRGRSRALKRRPFNARKRFLAFLMAMVMTFSNIGTNVNVAYADSAERVVFSMRGTDLVSAVDEAVMNGSIVTSEDLDFTNGKIEKFDTLFFSEGKVYEIYPEYDGGGMDAELRMFVRLPEDADDMYMVTGDEEIIFLYVNNGEESISCTTEITRMVDGNEKTKRTSNVTVKSYQAAFGDEEVNIISKPAETLPEEIVIPSDDETAAPTETESQAPTDAQEPTAESPEETTRESSEEPTQAPPETSGEDANATTEAETPADVTQAPTETAAQEET